MIFYQYKEGSYSLSKTPERIVCAVPSLTELLFDLGLGDKVVGLTKFCVHPRGKTAGIEKIGGTKQLNLQKITDLRPDLIICNKEENVKDQILALSSHADIYVSDIFDLESAFQSIEQIGYLTNTEEQATIIVKDLKISYPITKNSLEKPNVLYLIWKDPYMSIGGDTFISAMVDAAGYKNHLIDKKRYPIIDPAKYSLEELDYIFLSSEPYPFKEKHKEEIEKLFPNIPIFLVDGEFFSWYGSRMLLAKDYFSALSRMIRDNI